MSYGGVVIEETVTVTGIVDTSVFDQILCMYIDYDYLNSLVVEQGEELQPTDLYVVTDTEQQANVLKEFISNSSNYSGSMEERLANMFSEMSSTISIALAIIAGISLIVSAIMILTVLYMSVSERTKEIGVLKAIGARRKDIRSIFVSESFLVGLFSGIVGIIFSLISYGIFVAVFNALLGFAPLALRWFYFALAIGLSLLISMLSGLYPAAKAAKMDPVESLRRE